MFVEKLDVFGFKSFSQKLELTFGPGISGVLGPNGCGKSNLVDAFRWVLGEQSSKTLRGDKMEDVIFNGTRDVKPLSMCEVYLTLSNERGLLPVDFNQVTIGRRLYRSGQSEYTINRNPCRLKDIRDLFLDTGMGSHAYSVIERGMVDNVLSDNTGHRRFLFEEASGIMKYKTRKKEALSKLEATHADLVRLSDIISEVEKETESLKRQVGRAQRYRDLRDRLKSVDLASSQTRLRSLHQEMSGLKASGETLSAAEESAQARLATAENRLEELKLRQVTAERALVSARDELARLDHAITDLNHQVVILREREASTRERMAAAAVQIERLAARRLENDAESVRVEESLAGLEASFAGDVEQLGLGEKKLRQAELEFRDRKQAVSQRKQLSLDLFQERLKREGDLRQCRSELLQIETARDELDQERRNLAARRIEVSKRLAEARTRVALAVTAIEGKTADVQELTGRIVEIEAGLRESTAREAALRQEAAGVTSSLATLRNLRRTYESFDAGVRAVMQKHGADPAVLGTVADLVKVPGEWVEALRPVLSPALQWVVTRDVSTARVLMDDLASSAAGRVTFLPLDRLPAAEKHLMPAHPAVIAQARNLVQAPAGVRTLVDHLLGDVIVACDVNRAMELLDEEAFRGHRCVTPEGAMVSGVLLSGGVNGDSRADILGQEREIARLEERLEVLAEEISAAEALHRRAEEERDAAARELETRRAEADLLNAERTGREAEAGRLEGELLVVEEREADLTLREAGIAARRLALDESRERLDGALSEVSTDSQTAEDLYRREESLLIQAEADRDQALSDVSEARIRVATRESSRNECRERRERIRATAREIEADRARCVLEVAEGEERLQRLAAEIEKASSRVQEMHGGREDRVAAVADCERTWSDLGLRVNEAESEAREARRAAAQLREQAHGEELRRTELRGEWKSIETRLYEDYELRALDVLDMGLPWPESPEGLPLDPPAVEQLVMELKDRIKRLGPVNLLAIEEYEEKSTRLTFLKSQYEDLTRARGELMEAISQINTMASTLFMETFEKVCVNFQKTFQVLFQGGECSLQLLGDDPLEAEIEIVARPRGKKPQSIAQLSSGERALTAIALLFAIYLVKPSPFCLLDEVDAPLDDANVDRFVAMLREFSARTQFIVITHNKKTMEAADTLYGVTMSSPGVSQVVSVKLSEAEAVRDGKAAGRRRDQGNGNGSGNGNGRRESLEEVETVARIPDPVVQ